jgi:hypothetical protein
MTLKGLFTMKTFTTIIAVLLACPLCLAQDYYVAPDGNDTNAGTAAKPMATLAKAAELLKAGDTLWVKDGKYVAHPPTPLRCAGTKEQPVNICAEKGAHPIFDIEGGYQPGIQVKGAWCHLKGLTVTHAGSNGFKMSGQNETLENCTAVANGNTGIQIGPGGTNVTILNCDSYENFDPGAHGQNADGFGAKHDIGPGNKFVGCRSWNNSDDGYDLWYAENPVTIENCYSWANGVNIWNDPYFEGNGNGFKLGQMGSSHVLRNCVVWDQPFGGFDLNGNTAGVTVTNCTAYRCGTNFAFAGKRPGLEKNVLRKNIAFVSTNRIDPKVDDKENSWNTPGLEVTKDDFVSLDPKTAQGPRNPDGSLPKSDFLHLTRTSKAKGLGAFN